MNQNNNNNQPPKMPKKGKKPTMSISFWFVMLFLIVIIYNIYLSGNSGAKEVSYSQMLALVNQNPTTIVAAQINNKDVTLVANDKKKFHTYLPFKDPELLKVFQAQNIDIKSVKPSKFLEIVIGWLPFIILIAFWIFMMRSMQGGGSKAFSFGKSKAKLFAGGKTRVTFKDVAGVEEAKEELEEIVEFLKAPQKFQKLGGRIPRGVLLLGRPGTGKTLLAKAVAGEAKVPFFSMSGSDFVEMFVGVGASRVRDLFENAKKNAPCIAFIDEIDAVGRHRGSGLGGGHDEREQTLNQLLVEMDGFEKNDSVIIIAATNRPDVLDPALLRPGRFDRQVAVDLPDIKGREAILNVHTKKLPVAEDTNMQVIARSTPGFSGADLANLCNEAALLAARKDKTIIEMSDFEDAKDKVMMGKEKRSRVISEDEKRNTAYHEAGHVLCSVFQEKTEPVHKVTIIPRGFTGGATHFLQSEKTNYSRSYLEQKIIELLGGRAAEEIVFNELTTGAGNDIQRVTDLAKNMVCKWGMSKKIGPFTIGKDEQNMFLGKEISRTEVHSEETTKLVDSEIRSIINNGYESAVKLLTEKKNLLDAISVALLEKETLDVDEIFDILLDLCDDMDKKHLESKHKQAMNFKMETIKPEISNTEKTDENKENIEEEKNENNQQNSSIA